MVPEIFSSHTAHQPTSAQEYVLLTLQKQDQSDEELRKVATGRAGKHTSRKHGENGAAPRESAATGLDGQLEGGVTSVVRVLSGG